MIYERGENSSQPEERENMKKILMGGMAVAVTSLLLSVPAMSNAGVSGTWCGDRSNLAVVGASSETGYMTTGYAGSGEFYPTRYGWVNRTKNNVAAEWQTTTSVYARSGAFTKDFLEGGRWPVTRDATKDMHTNTPDLVIIHLGANEYLNQVDPAVFRNHLMQLVTDINEARLNVDTLFVGHWRIAKPGATYPWSSYASVIAGVARETGAAFIDGRQMVDGSDTDKAGLYATDKIHLNDAGQTVIYASIWSWIVAGC